MSARPARIPSTSFGVLLIFAAAVPAFATHPTVTEPEPPPACITSWQEARYRNYAYDHLVYIKSDCTRWASCEVTTDVSPEIARARVEPGETREVVTFRGSPSSEFVARVFCRLDE